MEQIGERIRMSLEELQEKEKQVFGQVITTKEVEAATEAHKTERAVQPRKPNRKIRVTNVTSAFVRWPDGSRMTLDGPMSLVLTTKSEKEN